MKDILDMTENKPVSAKSTKNKISKYTREQKIAVMKALELSRKLTKMLENTFKKNETI
jgi:hypothetical protein